VYKADRSASANGQSFLKRHHIRIGDEGPGEGYQVDPAGVQGFLSRAFDKSFALDDCSMKRFAHLPYETVAVLVPRGLSQKF
jgi:hypothetical protein